MLTLPSSVPIYMAAEPIDLRSGLDGLAARRVSLNGNPLSGHIFYFLNKRQNRIKFLVLDRTGYRLFVQKARARDVCATYAASTARRPAEIDPDESLVRPGPKGNEQCSSLSCPLGRLAWRSLDT